jgi:uncharacterized protein YqeY
VGLKDQIAEDLKEAMKARDALRLDAIRMLKASVQRREVDDMVKLDDAGVVAVTQKQIKQSEDAATQFDAGGRKELAARERAQIEIWKKYLPAMLSAEEIETAVREAIARTGAQSIKDMGKVMTAVKTAVAGRADMTQVSAKVKALLG